MELIAQVTIALFPRHAATAEVASFNIEAARSGSKVKRRPCAQ